MQVRKTYTLYINSALKTAYYGNTRFAMRICTAEFGKIYDCNLSDLKGNIRRLRREGYTVSPRNY